jgi:small subunit ribosomal protein S17
MSQARGTRRRVRGTVMSDKGIKTITVEVIRYVRHPKYGKRVKKNRTLHAHDEAGTAHVGDVVEIIECRPISKTKRHRLLRVIQRNPEAAGLPQATEVTPAP